MKNKSASKRKRGAAVRSSDTVRRSGVAETFSNVSEIPIKEARRLLRAVNRRGATSLAYLRAVNHCSNSTNRTFLETFKAWLDNPALLVALAPNAPDQRPGAIT